MDRGRPKHKTTLTREMAFELLKQYNKEPFHIRHSLTMEGVMAWYADDLGFSDEKDFWSQCGLLHDIDFEMWPESHCKKVPEILKAVGCDDDLIHNICSHGYGVCTDTKPIEIMEKVLFASDELTGLIWSTSLMHPGKSIQDIELKSVRKKFKDKRFATGCSRKVIASGAERLGWDLDTLIQKTITAMKNCEKSVEIPHAHAFS